MIVGGTPLLLAANREPFYPEALVVGDFDYINSIECFSYASLDYTLSRNSIKVKSGITASAIYCIAISGTDIYLGGPFGTVSGGFRNRIAAYDLSDPENPVLYSWNPNVGTGAVYDIYLDSGNVYFCGSFVTVGGISRRGVACYEGVTDPTPTLQGAAITWATTSVTIRAIVPIGTTHLLLLGIFSTEAYNLDSRSYCSNVLKVVKNPSNFGPFDNMNISCDGTFLTGILTSYSGVDYLVLGGDFDYGYRWVNPLTMLATKDVDDSAMAGTGFRPTLNFDGIVEHSVVQSDGNILVSGDFTATQGATSKSHLVSFTPAGAMASFNMTIEELSIDVLLVRSSYVYLGGTFTTVNGTTRYGAACIFNNGVLDNWNPFTSIATIRDMVLYQSDSRMLLAGSAYRVNVYYGLWSCYDHPNLSNPMYSGAIASQIYKSVGAPEITNITASLTSPYDVYLSGSFTILNYQQTGQVLRSGISVASVAGFTQSGMFYRSWEAAFSGEAHKLLCHSGYLYVGGSFSSIAGSTRNNIAALSDNPAGFPSVDTWNPNANDVVRDVAIYDSMLSVGGDFRSIAGQTRNRYAELNLAGTTASTSDFDINLDNRVNTICDWSSNGLFVGGTFRAAIGVVEINLILRRLVDTTFNLMYPGNRQSPRVGTLPAHQAETIVEGEVEGTFYVGGYFNYARIGTGSLSPRAGGAAFSFTSSTATLEAWAPPLSYSWKYLTNGTHLIALSGSPSLTIKMVEKTYNNASPTIYSPNAQITGIGSYIFDLALYPPAP